MLFRSTGDFVFVIAFISSISLMRWSPIDSVNKRLDAEQIKHYKKIVFGLCVAWLLVIIIMLWMKQIHYTAYIALGTALSAGLQVPCLMRHIVND